VHSLSYNLDSCNWGSIGVSNSPCHIHGIAMVLSPATAAGRCHDLYLCQPQTGETGGSGLPKSANATLQKIANLQELPSSFVDDKQAA
jgi:hypothetical protein